MCGIFGWVKFSGLLTPDQVESSRQATLTLVHRGPDGSGEWLGETVFMGHQRLSIIDLSDAASQPFQDDNGRYVLAFNGEIYNYLELRQELEAKGWRFRTRSDTEVLLYVLAQWGTQGLLRLDGMFAGALHDRKTGRHLLFRDPLGQKPLYFHVYEEGLVYASELRALLNLPQFAWRLDRQAFRRFLTHSYYPWDTTPVVDIEKLLPGCLIEIEGGTVTRHRWWDSVPGADPLDLGMDEAVAEFERLFDRSCALCMRSDVPVGVFLSGGLDSSLVLDGCHAIAPDVQAFSVSMAEQDFDESSKAVVAAVHVGGRHNVITLDQAALLESFTALMDILDEPHGDPGYVNTFFLSRESRSQITVAVAGDGADELLCGYAPFKGLPVASLLERIPAAAIGLGRRAADILPGSDSYLTLQFKALSFLQAFPSTRMNRHGLWLSTLHPTDLARLMPKAEAGFFDPMRECGAFDVAGELRSHAASCSPAQQMLYYYQKVFLPEFVCHHTDRAAMLHSLEVRSPFLSTRLFELVNQLPDRVKLQGSDLKRVLRETLRRRGFPPAVTEQPKQGFTFPIARWLKGHLRGMVDDLADVEAVTSGEVSAPVLQHLVDQHLAGRRNNYRIIYCLIVFKAWRKRYPGLDFA